jgi:hypothetical protein
MSYKSSKPSVARFLCVSSLAFVFLPPLSVAPSLGRGILRWHLPRIHTWRSQMRNLIFLCGLAFAANTMGYGQMVSRPKVYTRSVTTIPIDNVESVIAPDNVATAASVPSPGAAAPTPPSPPAGGGGQATGAVVSTTASQPPQTQAFSRGGVTLPTSSSSQYGASSRVFMVSVYGIPKCTTPSGGQQTCVSTYWFRASLDSNVVNSVDDAAGAIREYLFSQNGSPISLSIPSHTWTTQKPQVDRQSWFAASFFGSGRLIPVNNNGSGSTNNSSNTPSSLGGLTGGGALTVGGTGQANIEFDATDPGSDPSGKDTTYPGTLYFSFSPSVSVLAGAPLKTAIFQGRKTSSWTWGGDFRAGFQFKGKQPISLAVTGTFSAKGLTTSSNGVALSLSKLFGGGT